MNAPAALFESVRLGDLTLPNRMVMAPMSRARADADGTPSALMADYYAQRATAGLIVAEGTHPVAAGAIGPGAPGLFTDAHQDGWSRIADGVHAAGGRVFLQLMHAGRLAHPDFLPGGARPVAPSAVAADTLVHTSAGRVPAVTPDALTDTALRELIGGFVHSACRAVAAGLDGVEIHAANGYLLHQFLAENANLRTDRWGGDTEGRIRLTVDIARAVAGTVGPHRVGVRISPSNPFGDLAESDPYTTYTELIRALAPLRLAYLHHGETGTELDAAVRELWPAALVVTPLPADRDKPEAAAHSLDRGADLVSFGRDFLANPDLVTRCRIGAPLNEARPTGFYGGGATGYTDYPALAPAPFNPCTQC
ncbi:alkene reductase [Streptomyces qinzhouensis]|uniref:Alkene reductase n=1 Tax=Streptomyces qinzhouensis TaxID=2599401 RepID=A0A5B8JA60_9ACTN|nr:alkene reductase [Streptomyces qinzhouensis]QDY78216.1 alkene reductase [Streptomyces qinzhouensis]